jgi:Ca2+-transporting ATPase
MGAQIIAMNDQLAQNGMRVLGVAFRALDALPTHAEPALVEHDLIFVGMVGMIDPARAEAKQAVQTCLTAGIRPVMITGDHPLTARAIACELGIADGGRVLTGSELDRLSVAELEAIVDEVSVYARVSPEHKLMIIQALQATEQIVAMTGDGVNDAPALKQADIGVAMGISGTDVTKAAADMVLQDDNFATIVSAVAEGRVIFDNIRKFIKYLMTTNAGELWVMLLAPVLGMPLPLLPLQILWLELFIDTSTSVAFEREPEEPGAMNRRPRPRNEPLLDRGILGRIAVAGGFSATAAFIILLAHPAGFEHARWVAFTTLVVAQAVRAYANRSLTLPLRRLGTNRFLLLACLIVIAAQGAIPYIPGVSDAFRAVPLSAAEWLLAGSVAGAPAVVAELAKGRQPDRAYVA